MLQAKLMLATVNSSSVNRCYFCCSGCFHCQAAYGITVSCYCCLPPMEVAFYMRLFHIHIAISFIIIILYYCYLFQPGVTHSQCNYSISIHLWHIFIKNKLSSEFPVRGTFQYAKLNSCSLPYLLNQTHQQSIGVHLIQN